MTRTRADVVGTRWCRIASRARKRIVVAGLLVLLLVAFGCANEDTATRAQEDTLVSEAVVVSDQAEAPAAVVFGVGPDVYTSGPQGEATRKLFSSEDGAIDSVVVDPSSGRYYYIGNGETGGALWAVDSTTWEQELLLEGAIEILGVAADGRVMLLSEAGVSSLELVVFDPVSGDSEVVASSVGQAVCSGDGDTFGYLGALDAQDPDSTVAVFVRVSGDEPVLVRNIEPTEGAQILAITDDRFVFAVSAEGEAGSGEIHAYEIGSGELVTIASDATYLDGTADLSSILMSVHPEPGDETITQAVQMARKPSSVWDMTPVGDAVVDASLAAWYGQDAASALVFEATLGRADALRLYEAGSMSASYETTLQAGTAVGWCEMSPGSDVLFLVTQSSPIGSTQGIGQERLVAIDTASGDQVELAVSTIEQGGPPIRLIDTSGRLALE